MPGSAELIVSRLQADLRTRFPEITVSLVRDDEDSWAIEVRDGNESWGTAGTWYDEDEPLSDEDAEELLATIAFNVADNLWPDELTDPWPLCPAHGDHPLNPEVVRGRASWICGRDISIAIPVGDLVLLPSG